MGIKKRILLFVTLFGVTGGILAIIFNQLILKNSLVSAQERQVQTSVRLGQQKLNSMINEMELASSNLSLFAAELYKVKNKYTDLDPDEIVKSHLFNVFANHPESIGGGIWYEPYVFDANKQRYGPYVHQSEDGHVFTWELNTPEYDYHNQDWYKIAFSSIELYDKQRYWTEPYYDDAGTQELMVTVTTPILAADGSKLGVSTVDWAIKHLTDAVESIEFTENASSLLVDKKHGIYLSFPDAPKLQLTQVKQGSWAYKLLGQGSNSNITKLDDIEFNGLTGVVYFLNTKQQMVIGIFLPYSDYMQHINRFISVNLLLSSLLLVFLLFGLAFFLSKVFSPLSNIIEDIRASIIVDEKANSIRVNKIADVSIKEFSPIVKMLNTVYRKINEYTVQIEQKNLVLIEKQQEINELNADLEQKVEARTAELEVKTIEVLKVLDELKETQRQMVEMEKNAALGQLVAGVAHEVNTPIGVCITAASILKQKYLVVTKDLDNNQLTKSGLASFLEEINNLSEMLNTNLNRTKELIDNFKKVATDESEQKARTFNLAENMKLVVDSLESQIEQYDVHLNLSIAEDIEVDSFPEACTQVMTNLIMNSLTHAFTEQENNLITITAKQQQKNIVLVYSDNGCGMSEQVSEKIFEPFFTTCRGAGGTGLGMHISYNLVTQKLKGTIEVESTLDKGTQFTISFPKVIES